MGAQGGTVQMGRPTSRMMKLAVNAVRTAHLCERGAVKIDSALGGQTPAVCSHLPPPLSPHTKPGASQGEVSGDSIVAVQREDQLAAKSG